jgi:hypothetical protein
MMPVYGAFEPARGPVWSYGAIPNANPYANGNSKDEPEARPVVAVSRASFKRGVALMHTFLLFAIFTPPFMLCIQMTMNEDLSFFVGSFVAHLAYLVVAIIFLVPVAHLTTRLHPWAFLLSVWIPAFIFTGIGWYYRDRATEAAMALQSTDCSGFAEKRNLQHAYQQAQYLFDQCSDHILYSVEECPQYLQVYEKYPDEFFYLKGLENRYQCSGLCHSARRLWESAGSSAPACGLFAGQWVIGGLTEANFVLWYSVAVILASIPVFITLLDSFFKEYYVPLSK